MYAESKEEAEELVSLLNNCLVYINDESVLDDESILNEWSCGYDDTLYIRDSDGDDLSVMLKHINKCLNLKK